MHFVQVAALNRKETKCIYSHISRFSPLPLSRHRVYINIDDTKRQINTPYEFLDWLKQFSLILVQVVPVVTEEVEQSVFLVLQKLVVSMVEKMLLQPNDDQKHFYERLFEIQLFQSNVLGKKKRTLQVEDGLPVIDCRRCTGATSPTCSQTLRQKMFPEVFKHNLTLPTTSPSFTNSNPPSICGTNKIIRVRHWAKKVCELILIPWFKWTEHGK